MRIHFCKSCVIVLHEIDFSFDTLNTIKGDDRLQMKVTKEKIEGNFAFNIQPYIKFSCRNFSKCFKKQGKTRVKQKQFIIYLGTIRKKDFVTNHAEKLLDECRETPVNVMNTYVMLCGIWYLLHNFKNMENTHGGVLLLAKLLAAKSNTHQWVFSTFSKLYKWYQIA